MRQYNDLYILDNVFQQFERYIETHSNVIQLNNKLNRYSPEHCIAERLYQLGEIYTFSEMREVFTIGDPGLDIHISNLMDTYDSLTVFKIASIIYKF